MAVSTGHSNGVRPSDSEDAPSGSRLFLFSLLATILLDSHPSRPGRVSTEALGPKSAFPAFATPQLMSHSAKQYKGKNVTQRRLNKTARPASIR
jgi:hypothetical protein